MRRFRRVLYATDFSKASKPAFMTALELAKGNHASLLVVHALAFMPPILGLDYLPPRVIDQLEASAWAGVRAELKKLVGPPPQGRRPGEWRDRDGQSVRADYSHSQITRGRCDRPRHARPHRADQGAPGQCGHARVGHRAVSGADCPGSITRSHATAGGTRMAPAGPHNRTDLQRRSARQGKTGQPSRRIRLIYATGGVFAAPDSVGCLIQLSSNC
jgi:hypothetical protein